MEQKPVFTPPSGGYLARTLTASAQADRDDFDALCLKMGGQCECERGHEDAEFIDDFVECEVCAHAGNPKNQIGDQFYDDEPDLPPLTWPEQIQLGDVCADMQFFRKVLSEISDNALLPPLLKMLTGGDHQPLIDLLMPKLEAEARRRHKQFYKGPIKC
jgi:hypothetical protein